MATLEYWHPGLHCCNARWEAAYARFESAQQERRKFRKRFRALGIDKLPRDAALVDLFCGRGNGLRALQALGFNQLTGVDLSPTLLEQAPAGVRRIVADCTQLRFAPDSVDGFIVQGGLHHLPDLQDGLTACLRGVRQALRVGGRFYIVEPWETPFLKVVHAVTAWPLSRRTLPKFDAFATMVEEEITTYRQWLEAAERIEKALREDFKVCSWRVGFGKLAAVLEKTQ